MAPQPSREARGAGGQREGECNPRRPGAGRDAGVLGRVQEGGGKVLQETEDSRKGGLLVPALTLEELPVLSAQTKQAGPLMGQPGHVGGCQCGQRKGEEAEGRVQNWEVGPAGMAGSKGVPGSSSPQACGVGTLQPPAPARGRRLRQGRGPLLSPVTSSSPHPAQSPRGRGS